MLPLRDLLRELELEIVAGEAGLDRAVRWVHISELADPTPWLSGGELLLTTGLQLGDDAAARVRRAARRARADRPRASASASRTSAIPDALLRAAAAHGFPLFEVPVRAAVHRDHREGVLAAGQRAVRRPAARAVGARAARADRALRARAGRRRGRAGGADRRAGADLRRPRRAAGARAADAARRDRRAVVGAARARRARAGGAGSSRAPSTPGRAGAAGARGRAHGRGDGPPPEAWLIAAKDAGPLTELDRLTLHQAVTIVALELLRRRVVDDTERRLAGDVLSALVAGDLAGAELARRLEPFGLRERAGALVLAPPRGGARDRRGGARARGARGGGRRAGRARRAASCARCCRRAATTSCSRSPSACTRGWRGSRGEPLPAGAGRDRSRRPTCGAASTRRAARSRRARSRSTATADGVGELATYRDLGSFQLLLSLQDDDALRLFCDSILAPDRGVRGRLRRRADALAGGVHRVQRAVGARGEGALLPPSHAALPDPPRRGADRALAGLARATGSTSGSPCAGGSWSRPERN